MLWWEVCWDPKPLFTLSVSDSHLLNCWNRKDPWNSPLLELPALLSHIIALISLVYFLAGGPFSILPSAFHPQHPSFSILTFSIPPSASHPQHSHPQHLTFSIPPSAFSSSASHLQHTILSIPPSPSHPQHPTFSIPPSVSHLQHPYFQHPTLSIPPSTSHPQHSTFRIQQLLEVSATSSQSFWDGASQ